MIEHPAFTVEPWAVRERGLHLEQHCRPESGHQLGITHELQRIAESLLRVQQDRPLGERLPAEPEWRHEIAPQRREEALGPVQGRAAHPHDQEQRRARAAAVAVEHDLTHADRGHERIVAAPRYTGSPSC